MTLLFEKQVFANKKSQKVYIFQGFQLRMTLY